MEVMIGMKIGKVVCDKDKEKHEDGKEEEGEDDSKCGDEETEDEENDFRRTRRSWGGNRGRNNEVAILQLTTHCNRQRTPQSPHRSAADALLFWIVQSDHHTQCNHRTKSRTMWTCAVHKVPHIMERNRNGNSAAGKGNVMPCKAILRWGTSILRRGRQGSAKAKARQTCLRHTPSATPHPPSPPFIRFVLNFTEILHKAQIHLRPFFLIGRLVQMFAERSFSALCIFVYLVYFV